MKVQVSDIGSNHEENLQRWARTLGAGNIRRCIFLTVYKSKKMRWTIPEIALATGLDGKLIASEGRKMMIGGLFEQLDGSRVTYQRIAEVHHAKSRIIKLADNATARESLPTKRNSKGKVRIKMKNVTNKFENVGVANVGNMSGSITGNSQHNQLNESARELLQAIDKFKRDVENSRVLTPEQQEDAVGAVEELEHEAKKSQKDRSLSRVRNGVSALQTLSNGTKALHELYQQIHPFIVSHFHLT